MVTFNELVVAEFIIAFMAPKYTASLEASALKLLPANIRLVPGLPFAGLTELMLGAAAVTVTTFVTNPPATVYFIVAVPPDIGVTIPVALPTVATDVLLDVHFP
jgi:hypothetical protein